MKYKYLIYDFDGTISDSTDTVFDVFNALSESIGFRKIKKSERLTFRDKTIKDIYKELKIPWTKFPLLLKKYRQEYKKRLKDLKPITGVRNVLQSLCQKGFRQSIATSNNKHNVEVFLQKQNLKMFDTIHAGIGLFAKDKALKKILKKEKIKPKDAIYIGDETRDIKSCKKIKLKIAAVSWGFQSKKLLKRYKPDYLAEKPNDLLKIFGY